MTGPVTTTTPGATASTTAATATTTTAAPSSGLTATGPGQVASGQGPIPETGAAPLLAPGLTLLGAALVLRRLGGALRRSR
ncbi:MAG: hypothetical protein ACRD0M_03835 [Acidimicrobiales bacterium]